MSHLKVTQAGLLALLTTIIGQIVAFVPQLASQEQLLISIGSTAISLGFLLANAIHAVASAKLSTSTLELDVEAAVHRILGQLAQHAVRPAAAPSQPPAPQPAPAQAPATVPPPVAS